MLEMLELAERLARLDGLGHPHRLAIDHGLVQLEPRFAARCGRMREDFQRRCEHRAAAEIAKRIRRMLHHLRARRRERTRPCEPVLLHVKGVIQHFHSFLA